MKNITIHLVRHAESCSNVFTNEIVDRYKDKKNIDSFNKMVDGYKTSELKHYNDNKCIKNNIYNIKKKLYDIISSELSKINKTESEINRIIKKIEEICKTKKNCLDFIKNDRMFSKRLKNAIYILTRMDKATYMFESNLSYIGMNQAINLGKNFINMNYNNYDIILTSAKVRTIMTALLSLRLYNITKPIKIIVVPYMNELSSEAKLIDNDKMNTGVESSVLKKQVQYIKIWLKNNWIEYYDDIEIIDDLIKMNENTMNPYYEEINILLKCKKDKLTNQCKSHNIIDIIKKILVNSFYKTHNIDFITKYTKIIENIDTFITGCEVDFSFLEQYENNFKNGIETNNPCISNMVYFYTNVVEKICNYCQVNKDNIKILLYLHGRLIQDIYDMHYYNFMHNMKIKMNEDFYSYYAANTIVYEQNITYDSNFLDLQLNDIKILQRPIFIRSMDKQIINESYNNVCDISSLRGKINLDKICFDNM